MREDVNIILNEREARKAQLAEELVRKLQAQSITASRLPPTENLAAIVLERKPRIIVTDYLLENFGTGLDLLDELQKSDPTPPRFIFLTDEPSLSAAVEAMRIGADDYLEIDSSNVSERLIKQIKNIIPRTRQQPRPTVDQIAPTKANLVWVAPKSRSLIESLPVLATKSCPCLILFGPEGCGKRTMARLIAHGGEKVHAVAEYDLRLDSRPLTEILQGAEIPDAPDSCTILTHAEEEAAELARIFTYPDQAIRIPRHTIFCTHDEEALRILKAIPQGEVLRIPSLSERRQDIPALSQHALARAATLLTKRVPALDSDSLAWLMQKTFPGEIRELNEVVTNSALRAALSGLELQSCLSEVAAQWELEWQSQWLPTALSQSITPLSASYALQRSNHDTRIAALRLGVTAADLQRLLQRASCCGLK